MGLAGSGVGTRVANAKSEDVPLADKVPTKKLGTTGYDIPILLMGGAIKFDPTFDRMLHSAHKDGKFYIDTAEAYAGGQSLIIKFGNGAPDEEMGLLGLRRCGGLAGPDGPYWFVSDD